MSIAPQHSHLLRVGDLARLTGKSVRAIHLYEELGLLQPTTRSSGFAGSTCCTVSVSR